MDTDFRKILSDIKKGFYKRMGSGSGRMVFDLGNGTVIKVAKNVKGIAQNQAEHEISQATNNGLLAKVIDTSDDFRFLIMEKAEKINRISTIWMYFNVRNNRELKKVPELVDISGKYNLLLSDFGRSVNWGKVNGKPVIIDYGFTKSVARKYYRFR